MYALKRKSVGSGFFFLAPWLVFAPLTGLLVNLILGRRWSEKAVGTVASLASGAAFVVSVLLAYSVSINHGEVMAGAWPNGSRLGHLVSIAIRCVFFFFFFSAWLSWSCST